MSLGAFWKSKSLDEMSAEEWDALCDHCGQCCLHKLEDVDTGAIAVTDIACAYLDLETCSCSDYANRKANVPDCIQLTPQNVGDLPWLPETCAYRLLANGKALAQWHPLISGDPETVHQAGISVRGKALSETGVEDMEDHITRWIEAKVKRGGSPFG